MANRIQKVNNKGQALVEFAFSIIVLMIFVFGIFEVGRLFHMKIVLANSAREAVRFLIRHTDDFFLPISPLVAYDLTKKAALDEANNYGINITTADIVADCGGCEVGDRAIVTITMEIDIGIVSNLFGIITMEETAIMRVP